MTVHRFHDLIVEITHRGREIEAQLAPLLQALALTQISAPTERPSLCFSVGPSDRELRLPAVAREVFRANGIHGLEAGNDFYLTDGSSLIHLQLPQGRGEARLTSAFFAQPLVLQVDFLAFGLIKLLRPLGLYGLHAAGVVTPEGVGVLITGPSGSGKSTLAVGLIQHGWNYLADEVVLLRMQSIGIKALAMSTGFYVDASTVRASGTLALEEELSNSVARPKRRIGIEEAYPRQFQSQCFPRVILCSRVVPEASSSVRPLDRVTAAKHLLEQSGPQWFDRDTMPHQLEILKRLILQTAVYELVAGLDLYRNPTHIVHLLSDAMRDR